MCWIGIVKAVCRKGFLVLISGNFRLNPHAIWYVPLVSGLRGDGSGVRRRRRGTRRLKRQSRKIYNCCLLVLWTVRGLLGLINCRPKGS